MANTKVVFKRGTQEMLDAMPIVDGQLLYNIDTGETWQDVENRRIATGGSSDAVLTTPQELTEEQKKQARKNISALPVGLGMADASVGDLLRVKTVDTLGIPTELEAVSFADMEHPVGSWWLSDDPTSPAQLFGGTWERLEGCFLLGADASHPAGNTGGAFEITQQSGQVGEHWHKAVVTDPYHGGPAISEGNRLNYKSYDWAPGEQVSYMPVIESNLVDGDGVSHPVQPMDITNPYCATYIWRRIE